MKVGNSLRFVFTVILVCFIVLTMQGCSKDELTDAEYLANSKEYLDRGELRAAVIEAKNALRLNSKNAEVRWLLGNIYIEIGDGLSAEKELNRARELGVSDDAVLPLLYEALLLQRNYSRLLEQNLTSVHDNKALAKMMAARGFAYIFQKDLDKATQEIDAALKKGPNLPYVLTAKARLVASEGGVEEARTYLGRALALKNNYALAWSLLGDLATHEGEPEKAIDAYTKAIKNQFNNVAELLKRTQLFIQLERYEEAQADLDSVKRRFPKHTGIKYAQGMLYFFQKRFPEAQVSLEQYLAGRNVEKMAFFYLGSSHFFQGHHEQAKENLIRFVEAVPYHISGRKMLAQIRLKDNEFIEVDKLIRPIVSANPDDVPALNMLASSLFKQGSYDEAIALLEKVVELQPEMAQARMRLGVSLLAKGEKDRGIKNLENAIEIDPQFQQPDIYLILNYMKENNYEMALKTAESFTARHPENVIANNLLGMVYLAGNKIEEAEQTFLAVIKLEPGEPGASRQLALLALKSNDPEKARDYLNRVIKAHPGHLQTLLALADLELRQGKKETMEMVLKNAIKIHPDALQPRTRLAQVYLTDGRIDQASLLLGDIPEKYRSSPQVLALFGELHLNSKDFLAAKLTIQQLIKLQPNSANAHFLLAQVYEGLNDLAGVKKELELTLELEPSHLLAKVAFAKVMLSEGNINSAKQQLEKLKGLGGEHPEVMVLEAAILAQTGETNQALATYEKLYEKFSSTKTLLMLTGFQWTINDRQASIANLEQWNKENPGDLSSMLTLANHYLVMERKDAAVKQYQQVLKFSENNVIALNNLAWNLRKSDPAQALAYAEKANTVAPESLAVMDTLIVILLEKGDLVRTQRLIERALKQQPENPTLLYRRAMYLEKSGKQNDAIESLEVLLKLDVKFSERIEAEQLLEQLSGS